MLKVCTNGWISCFNIGQSNIGQSNNSVLIHKCVHQAVGEDYCLMATTGISAMSTWASSENVNLCRIEVSIQLSPSSCNTSNSRAAAPSYPEDPPQGQAICSRPALPRSIGPGSLSRWLCLPSSFSVFILSFLCDLGHTIGGKGSRSEVSQLWSTEPHWGFHDSVVFASPRCFWLTYLLSLTSCTPNYIHESLRERGNEAEIIQSPAFICGQNSKHKFIPSHLPWKKVLRLLGDKLRFIQHL